MASKRDYNALTSPTKDCNMNRLLITAASRAAAPSRSCSSNPASLSFATNRCVFATRHFSDSTTDTDTSTSPDNTNNDEIKTGVVKHFNTKEAYGFIIPSWIDESKLQENDKIFIHRNDIRRVQIDGSSSSLYYPNLRRGDKVQFKLGPPDEGKKNGKAHDLTMEGGQIVAPFPRDHLEKYMRTCKARFGDEVYDIFSTSQDQNELESKIVAAYDKVHEAIETRREHVKKSLEACGLEYHE